ncbi:MAG: flagellar M-ring protein FliF C-terminal domain-containing protein [Gammaproteobacteria bacterium]
MNAPSGNNRFNPETHQASSAMNDAHYSSMRFGKSAMSRIIGAMMALAFSAVICVAVVLWLQASSVFSSGDQDVVAKDPGVYLASNLLDYKKKIEEHLTQRIINILTPVVDSNGMRVQLSADVDFTQPEVGVSGLENEQTAEEKINRAGEPVWSDAIGKAGAASNKTINDKSLSTWKIRRLTVAVVLDDRHIVDADGKFKTMAYTPEAINPLSELVQQAAGIDGGRGDRVTIRNVAFRPAAEIKSGLLIPVWERAWFSDLIKKSIAVVTVIFLLLGVLRPVVRGLLNRGAEDEKTADQAAVDAKHAGVTGRDGASGDKAGSIPVSAVQKSANHVFSPFTAAQGYPKNLQDFQSLVDENPKLAAQIIQSWSRDEPIR